MDKVLTSMVQKTLWAAQKPILLLLTRACKTISNVAIQVISGMLPMDLEVIRSGLHVKVRKNIFCSWNYYTYLPVEDINEVNLTEEYDKIDQMIYDYGQNRWDLDLHGRDTYEYIKKVTFKSDNDWFVPNRFCVYVITGYGPFNYTLTKKGIKNNRSCPNCRFDQETADHVIFDCDVYEQYRYEGLLAHRKEKYKLIEEEKFDKFIEFYENVIKKRDTLQ